MEPENTAISTVSIHAPVKDATRRAKTSHLLRWSFNPRTRKGCDALRARTNIL